MDTEILMRVMNRSKVKNNAFVERRNRVLWTYMCTYKFINVAVHREKTHNVLGFLRSRVERKWKLISSSPKSDEKCLQTYRLNLTAVYELSRVGRKMHLRKKLLIFAASSLSLTTVRMRGRMRMPVAKTMATAHFSRTLSFTTLLVTLTLPTRQRTHHFRHICTLCAFRD